eukprot:SAG22_NODE_11014_length_505_cov_0.763547_1_plen_36_part_10
MRVPGACNWRARNAVERGIELVGVRERHPVHLFDVA